MSNWRPVDVRLWGDRKFLACSDGARLLWLFLLTCPSLPLPGVVVGGDGALAEQIGWSPERLREGFAELARNGLEVRREARIVWLPNALKYQPPAGPNAIKCWGKKWDDVPEGDLKAEMWEALRIACKSWGVLFAKLFPKPIPEPIREPLGIPSWMGSTHKHQHDHDHQHNHNPEESALPRAIPPPPPEQVPQYVQPPEPILPASRDAAEARRRLIGRAWQLGGEAFRRVQASGIDPTAPNGWSGMPAADSPPMANLRAIVDSLLIGEAPNVTAIEAKIANRILVAEADARSFSPPTARYMTPARMWNRESFSIAVDLSPEQAAAPRSRAGPRGSAVRAAEKRDDRVGQARHHPPSDYPDGEIPL